MYPAIPCESSTTTGAGLVCRRRVLEGLAPARRTPVVMFAVDPAVSNEYGLVYAFAAAGSGSGRA